MCNVPTSQVHETGEVEASWVDPQSWKIHRLSTWSRRADPAMWDAMWWQEMYDLGWPYHITSHHSMSTWAKAPAKWLPFTSFTGFHRISPAVTSQFQFLHWRRCRKRAHSHVTVRRTVRQSFSVAKFKLLFDTAMGAEGSWDTNIIHYLESLFTVWFIFYNKLCVYIYMI